MQIILIVLKIGLLFLLQNKSFVLFFIFNYELLRLFLNLFFVKLMETALWAPGVTDRKMDTASSSIWTEVSCTKASGLTALLSVEPCLILGEKQRLDQQCIQFPR